MIFRKIGCLLLAFALFFQPSLPGRQSDLLEFDEVDAIMQQMLEQHVQHQEVTPEIIQRAIRLYIDHFDPGRIYLTSQELDPYLNPTSEELNHYLKEYKDDDFTVFEEIDHLIRQSIHRARAIRGQIREGFHDLFELAKEEGALGPGLLAATTEKPPFATDNDALHDRIQESMVRYIARQRKRYGDEILLTNSTKVFDLMERNFISAEAEYLNKTGSGQSKTDAQQEHSLSVRILKSLAKSLDSHSAFFNASEAYDMRVRLEKGFQGIGVVLQDGFDGIVITRLIEGGPAKRSGLILANDRLVEVDGISVFDVPFEELLDKIRGLEGSTVDLVLRRPSEASEEGYEVVNVSLKRERIVVDDSRVDVSYQKIDDGIIGKITLYSFYDGEGGVSSEADVRKALEELHSYGRLKGLVLDLRYNTGGFLVQAVKVAGLFISNGVIVSSKYSDGVERVFRDLDGHVYYSGPLVVLTSRLSASAAEIVAQSLQDYGSAIVVGDEQTYGKGSIQHQNVTEANSASFYKVTVGRYYTVSGRTPQIQGVKADIILPGVYQHEQIGESYLAYPLSADRIEPSFVDDLDDVSSEVRYWYVRYYLPSLQQPDHRWLSMVPELRERSRQRIQNSSEYKENLSVVQGSPAHSISAKLARDDSFALKLGELQMAEAVNIVQDMIDLREEGAIYPVASSRKEP